MPTVSYETMKAFEGADEFENRIVAFIDVMGMKNRLASVTRPDELRWYATIMNMFAHQPFAEGKLHVTMFSDCMYIVTERQYIDQIICLLANFSFRLLNNNVPEIIVHGDGSHHTINHFDCFKLRGGITYGSVFMLDEEAKKRCITLNSNILLGKAVMGAYELESTKAVYPRIIVDDHFLSLMEEMGKTPGQYFLVQENGQYYLDFLDYMCQGKRTGSGVLYSIEHWISYVEDEIKTALVTKNAKLVGQLLWYKEYLQKHMIT